MKLDQLDLGSILGRVVQSLISFSLTREASVELNKPSFAKLASFQPGGGRYSQISCTQGNPALRFASATQVLLRDLILASLESKSPAASFERQDRYLLSERVMSAIRIRDLMTSRKRKGHLIADRLSVVCSLNRGPLRHLDTGKFLIAVISSSNFQVVQCTGLEFT